MDRSPPRPAAARMDRPAVPVTYACQWLSLMASRGIAREQILQHTRFDPALLEQPSARLTTADFVQMLANGFALVRDPAIGYAFGLDTKPTSHGFLGYALLTCSTLREAVQLGERYMRLRTNATRLKLIDKDDVVLVQLEENFELGPFRQFILESLTGSLVRIGEFLLGNNRMHDGEIWVDYDEPAYYQEWRDRLPPIRFNMPCNQFCIAREMLDIPLALADPVASRTAIEQLERELAVLGQDEGDDIATRVLAVLNDPLTPFGDLDTVARQLFISSRTLKRHLQQQGTTFQHLLDEVRMQHAQKLLLNSRLSIENIAQQIGYADAANFTRAFRRWTGLSPTAWRQQQ